MVFISYKQSKSVNYYKKNVYIGLEPITSNLLDLCSTNWAKKHEVSLTMTIVYSSGGGWSRTNTKQLLSPGYEPGILPLDYPTIY